jgi:ABC-type uncharacterized transport system ATPase subunit
MGHGPLDAVRSRSSPTSRLSEFDLTVARGEVVGLAGVAGAGHHAVLELVSGLHKPDRGEVVLPSGKTVPPTSTNSLRCVTGSSSFTRAASRRCWQVQRCVRTPCSKR